MSQFDVNEDEIRYSFRPYTPEIKREPHPMFAELHALDEKFQPKYRAVRASYPSYFLAPPAEVQEAFGREIEADAIEVVRQYIAVMVKYRDTITEETLLDERNEMRDYIDPVFAAIARLVYGPGVVTDRVYKLRIRRWCEEDIPPGYNNIAALTNDGEFIKALLEYKFSPMRNVKFSALQKLGKEELENLCKARLQSVGGQKAS